MEFFSGIGGEKRVLKMKKGGKYRLFLIPGVIILASAFSLILILPKQIGGCKNEWSRIKEIKEEVKDLRAKNLLISSLDETKLEEQASLALAALPESKNVPYILQGLRESLNRAGFLIRDLKFTPGEISKESSEETKARLAEKKIETLPLELKIIGPFQGVVGLLGDLEKATPFFQVQNFQLDNPEKEAGNSIVELDLVTFYSPPLAAYKVKAINLEDLILSEDDNRSLDLLSQLNLTVVKEVRTEILERKTGDPFNF